MLCASMCGWSSAPESKSYRVTWERGIVTCICAPLELGATHGKKTQSREKRYIYVAIYKAFLCMERNRNAKWARIMNSILQRKAQLKAEQRSFLRTLREKVTEQSPQLLSPSLPSALCPLVPKTTGHLG